MKRKAAQGVLAVLGLGSAANEDFALTADGSRTAGAAQRRGDARPAWDPYEVWRTRVKGAAPGTRENGPTLR